MAPQRARAGDGSLLTGLVKFPGPSGSFTKTPGHSGGVRLIVPPTWSSFSALCVEVAAFISRL